MPGVAFSKSAATSARKASPSSSLTTIVSPGFVQNCPAPSEQESKSSLAIAERRSASAPRRTNTGLTLDISRKMGLPALSAASFNRSPALLLPVNPVAPTEGCETRVKPTSGGVR